MPGVPFGVFPLFARTEGVRGVLLTGFVLGSVSDSPTAAKRDRFGEGGGRLYAATDQCSTRVDLLKIKHTKRRPASAWSPSLSKRVACS